MPCGQGCPLNCGCASATLSLGEGTLGVGGGEGRTAPGLHSQREGAPDLALLQLPRNMDKLSGLALPRGGPASMVTLCCPVHLGPVTHP